MRRNHIIGLSAFLIVGLTSPHAMAAPVCPAPDPSPNAPPIVAPVISQQSASQTVGLIADRIASVVSSFNSAVAGPVLHAFDPCAPHLTEAGDQLADSGSAIAGKSVPNNSAWTGGSLTRISKSDAGGRFSGSVTNGVVGYDRRLTPDLLLGAAVGYESVDIKTRFNNGTVESSSVSVAPYVGYTITDWLAFDATLGHTWIDYDFTRNDDAVKGGTGAGRWFGATNLTATQRYGAAKAFAGIGYLRLREEQDAYAETDGTAIAASTIDFGQARATVGGAYDFVTTFGTVSPNGFARLEYDTPRTSAVLLGNGLVSSTDRSGMVFGLGIDLATEENLTVGLSATTTQFRENTEIYSFAAIARYRF